ncbi:pentapeptide repeat-containing protein [Altericista sp. CCNU0014]|uniref:serine/threonine-protein kinase n=1 Tax=Altericista sp. CCNU0014 TaxID=3082949 RepID=UPI00384F3353
MSYCLNPDCNNPNNAPTATACQTCGATLLLRDRYRSSRILGRGGFATTFLAVDEGLPGLPTCVIKQLRPVLNAAHILEMSRELFQREAATLGKIGNHPQLPRLLDYFELGQDFYLIQEYVSGATLQQEVRRSGPFDEPMTKEVLREVLPILDYLHQQQVIHRDIKPANIIRRSIDRKLVLIDFGAVKDQVSQAAANNPDHTTLTAFAVGTPGFAPPEQMAMRPVYASDVYSLGITCIYLLTGKSPKDLNYNQATGELEWQNRVQISPRFQRLLEKMLEVSLRDRYQNAREVSQALDELQAAANAPAAPPPPSPSGTSTYAPQRPTQRSTTAGSGLGGRTSQPSAARAGAQDPMAGSFSKIAPRKSVSRAPSAGATDQTGSGGRKSVIKLSPQGLQQAYGQGKRDFSGHDLSNLSLSRFQLPSAIFHEAQLQNSDLRGADLNGANLGKASLVNANLRHTNLQDAYLSYADLEGADLRGADLSSAYLSNANLRGANLCGANLTGATLNLSQLSLAHINWMTILPNGKRGRGLW